MKALRPLGIWLVCVACAGTAKPSFQASSRAERTATIGVMQPGASVTSSAPVPAASLSTPRPKPISLQDDQALIDGMMPWKPKFGLLEGNAPTELPERAALEVDVWTPRRVAVASNICLRGSISWCRWLEYHLFERPCYFKGDATACYQAGLRHRDGVRICVVLRNRMVAMRYFAGGCRGAKCGEGPVPGQPWNGPKACKDRDLGPHPFAAKRFFSRGCWFGNKAACKLHTGPPERPMPRGCGRPGRPPCRGCPCPPGDLACVAYYCS